MINYKFTTKVSCIFWIQNHSIYTDSLQLAQDVGHLEIRVTVVTLATVSGRLVVVVDSPGSVSRS